MRVLVINSGSSSVKFSIFEVGGGIGTGEPQGLFDGELGGIGGAGALLRVGDGQKKAVEAGTLGAAIALVFDAVSVAGVEAVGYRVVHPGAKLNEHARITEEVLKDLEEAVVFAPLHDPAVIEVIREGMRRFPAVAHYACFDTVFHGTMPEEATTYPIPKEYRDRGVRRYGFHGLSCESIVRQLRAAEGGVPRRMVIAHLGSGCSLTALVEGRSVDTTMGLTPTGGVVMGTRPGDLDPGLVVYLLREQGGARASANTGVLHSVQDDDRVGGGKDDGEGLVAMLETMLNRASGMVALTGMANDMKAVREAAGNGNEAAVLGLKVFTRSVRKAIGGFCWLLGGLDAVVFAGGIGEHDGTMRAEVLAGLEGLGVEINSSLNERRTEGMRRIEASHSETAVFVVPAEEDLMIAVHVARMAGAQAGA